jgi:hypothetical protein
MNIQPCFVSKHMLTKLVELLGERQNTAAVYLHKFDTVKKKRVITIQRRDDPCQTLIKWFCFALLTNLNFLYNVCSAHLHPFLFPNKYGLLINTSCH